MSRLFVSRTAARRPRNATPQLETLEQVLSLSSLSITGVSSTNSSSQKYELTDVMVESVSWNGPTGDDHTPTESVSSAFAKAAINYSKLA
jgi:hypothetical protein